MLHLSDQQTGDIGRQSRELFEIFTHFHSESRFWVGNWTNLAKYDQRANSTGHIKVWFMRSLPGSCAGSGYTAATGCGKIELSSGRNFRVGCFQKEIWFTGAGSVMIVVVYWILSLNNENELKGLDCHRSVSFSASCGEVPTVSVGWGVNVPIQGTPWVPCKMSKHFVPVCVTCIQIVHGVKVTIESEVRGTVPNSQHTMLYTLQIEYIWRLQITHHKLLLEGQVWMLGTQCVLHTAL